MARNDNGGIFSSTSTGRVTVASNVVVGNSAVSGFAIAIGGVVAIHANDVSGNEGGGINASGRGTTISGNTVSNNGFTGVNVRDGDISVTANTVSGNSGIGIFIDNFDNVDPYVESTVLGNRITENGRYGIYTGANTAAQILHNQVTDNGGGLEEDIFVSASGIFPATPNISFNTYDDIAGVTGTGKYNVNSIGGDAPVP